MKIEITKDTTYGQIERLKRALRINNLTHVQYNTEHVVNVSTRFETFEGRAREPWEAHQIAFAKAYELHRKQFHAAGVCAACWMEAE